MNCMVDPSRPSPRSGVSFLYGMAEDGPEIIDVRIKSETSISVTEGPKSFETKKSLGYSFVTGKLI